VHVRQVEEARLVELRELLFGLGQLRRHEVDGGLHSRVRVCQRVQRRAPRRHALLGRRQVAGLQVQQRHVHAQVEQRRLRVRRRAHFRRHALQELDGRARVAQPRGHRHRHVRQLQLVHAVLKVGHEVLVQAHQHVVARRAERGRRNHLLQLQRQLVVQPPRVQVRQLAQRAAQVGPRRLQLCDKLRRRHVVEERRHARTGANAARKAAPLHARAGCAPWGKLRGAARRAASVSRLSGRF
jgi:hypothetical protein